MSRFDSLEHVHYTFCLESLQLRVDDQKCPTANYSITAVQGNREKRKRKIHKLNAIYCVAMCRLTINLLGSI